MGSYYNRPWRGFVEFEFEGYSGLIKAQEPIISVEHGEEFVHRVLDITFPGIPWRIVDVGGNVYTSGRAQEAPDANRKAA